ncbi:uncharacterized protein LOC144421944 [Styela clava]
MAMKRLTLNYHKYPSPRTILTRKLEELKRLRDSWKIQTFDFDTCTQFSTNNLNVYQLFDANIYAFHSDVDILHSESEDSRRSSDSYCVKKRDRFTPLTPSSSFFKKTQVNSKIIPPSNKNKPGEDNILGYPSPRSILIRKLEELNRLRDVDIIHSESEDSRRSSDSYCVKKRDRFTPLTPSSSFFKKTQVNSKIIPPSNKNKPGEDNILGKSHSPKPSDKIIPPPNEKPDKDNILGLSFFNKKQNYRQKKSDNIAKIQTEKVSTSNHDSSHPPKPRKQPTRIMTRIRRLKHQNLSDKAIWADLLNQNIPSKKNTKVQKQPKNSGKQQHNKKHKFGTQQQNKKLPTLKQFIQQTNFKPVHNGKHITDELEILCLGRL